VNKMTMKTIEEYRKEVDARPFETHNKYRNRIGTMKRHAILMASKKKWWERKAERDEYKEMCKRVKSTHDAKVKSLQEAKEGSFQREQIMYDFLRGAYGEYEEAPPWITGVYLSMQGIEVEETEVVHDEVPGVYDVESYLVLDEHGSFDIDEGEEE